MTRVRRARLLLPLLLACGAAPAAAQRDTAAAGGPPRVDVGVQPDTVTVGDRFVVLLRVQAPPGARVEPPARLDSTPELHPVGGRIDRADAAARVAGFGYPMVAWRPGALPARSTTVRVTHPDGRVATLRVPLRRGGNRAAGHEEREEEQGAPHAGHRRRRVSRRWKNASSSGV